MAIAEDASSPPSVTAVNVLQAAITTASFTPVTGSILVGMAAFDWNTNYSGTPAVAWSDSLGETWTPISSANGGSGNSVLSGIAYKVVGATTALTVTATSPDALKKDLLITVKVLTGTAVTGTIGTSLFSNHATTTDYTQQTVSTTTTGSLIVAVFADDNNNVITVNANTTEYTHVNDSHVSAVVMSGKATALTGGTPGSLSIGWTGAASGFPICGDVAEIMPLPAATFIAAKPMVIQDTMTIMMAAR